MRVLLAVPSKGRADIFFKNTFQWLQQCQTDWRVFLEAQDDYPYLDGSRIVRLPERNLGLGFSKEVIKTYAQENGYDAIFKIDDDLKGWTDFRKTLDPVESAVFFERTLSGLVKILEEKPDVAGFGFPYSFQMYERFAFKKTKRVQTAFLMRTSEFHADRTVDVFEDFAASLYPIVRGKLVLTCGAMGINMGVPVGGGTGGHQSFTRDDERAKRCCDAMRKIYPPLKLRKVEGRTWSIEPDFRSIKIGLYL